MYHIFYHGDLDGHCAGAIVALHLRAYTCATFTNTMFHSIDYGLPFPWEQISKDDIVYMVDFSLPGYQMVKLNKCCDLIWIDHHKTSVEWDQKSKERIKGVRVIGQSGCELTWKELFSDIPIPRFVHLLGRYDVWDNGGDDWEEEILPFQYAMRARETDPANRKWESWLSGIDDFADHFIDEGRSILKAVRQRDTDYMEKYSFEAMFDNYLCICVNSGLMTSRAFVSKYDSKRHDIMLSFVKRENGWVVNLFSTKVDVSKVAKKHGGGGHIGASGFTPKHMVWSRGRSKLKVLKV